MKNMFYSKDNLSKLCTEGMIRNLMNLLRYLVEDMTTFWELATSSLSLVMSRLKEYLVPKAFCHKGIGIDSIQKCQWILCKTFKFGTTSKLKLNLFQSLKMSLKALLEIKISMLISVQSSQATYNHVVVVWRNMVIDFECMHTYALTEESLRQVCGVYATFLCITCGCGIIPSKPICSSMDDANINHYKPKGSVMEYFYVRNY
jgi:hypothetical protein